MSDRSILSFNIEEDLKKVKTIKDLVGRDGILKPMVKEMSEQLLEAEMSEYLGYEKQESTGKNSVNSRNGKTDKAVRSDYGELTLEIPRDRNGSFEPQLVKKGQTDISEFDEKIISMYGRGMTTRDIQATLEETYGLDVSTTFISSFTDKSDRCRQSVAIQTTREMLYDRLL